MSDLTKKNSKFRILKIQLEDAIMLEQSRTLASGKGRCCGVKLTLVLDDYHDYLSEAISTFLVVCS
jgi:hypothetical protein